MVLFGGLRNSGPCHPFRAYINIHSRAVAEQQKPISLSNAAKSGGPEMARALPVEHPKKNRSSKGSHIKEQLCR